MKTTSLGSLVFLPAFALLACGAPTPDAATPPSPSAEASASPEAIPLSSDAPAPSAVASAAPAAAPPPEPARAASTITGTLLGKAFKPVGACVIGATRRGSVTIEIYDVKGFDVKARCGELPADSGGRKMSLVLPWKEGATLDVSTLKGDANPEGFVMEALPKKKFARKDVGKDWKPKGSVDVVHVSVVKGGIGRIRVSINGGGKDKLDGEIDVEVPLDVNEQWAAAP